MAELILLFQFNKIVSAMLRTAAQFFYPSESGITKTHAVLQKC